MKTNKFWSLLMMLVMALSMVSCGSDDDEKKDDDGEDGTTVTTEYTATTEVKKAKLNNINVGEEVSLRNPICVIYADFNYKYALTLYRGYLRLEPLFRRSGRWWNDTQDISYRSYGDISFQSLGAIKDLGKLVGIATITEKNLEGRTIAAVAQPQHGYAMKFKTENDEWKYLRVYIKGYTLDDKEALSSITVQYQLY